MTTANRFSSLFKPQAKTSSPIDTKSDPEPELTLESELTLEPEIKSEHILRTSAKKTPTKIILGHRSYEDELREKDEYYLDQGTSVYDILADKEKLAGSLVKSQLCSITDKNEECQDG